MRRFSRARGFTLVELSVVVVIVGVLAVLAVVGYSRYRTSARLSEATHLTGTIRTAQEAYKVEFGVYARISKAADAYYPADKPGAFTTAWGGACSNCDDSQGWKRLPVTPDGPVMYGYATVAGVGADAMTTDQGAAPKVSAAAVPKAAAAPAAAAAATPTDATLASTTPYYITVAYGDTNDDGVAAKVVSYSISTQLMVQEE
jgi:type IV pilus assembly protein PilA